MSIRDDGGFRDMADSSGESTTGLVVRAVAAHSNTPVSELPPLFETINPDALDALFVPKRGDVPPSVVTVKFDYAGYDVTVYPDHTIHVEETDDPID